METTADNKLKSLYWLQFEAYLPDKDYRYDYEDTGSDLKADGAAAERWPEIENRHLEKIQTTLTIVSGD